MKNQKPNIERDAGHAKSIGSHGTETYNDRINACYGDALKICSNFILMAWDNRKRDHCKQQFG